MISHISVGLFALSLLVIPALSQSQVWGQCGGIGWTGPTTCVAGTVCTFFNAYYSQCLPGTSTPPPVSSSATQSTAPTSTSSSAATSSTGSSAPGACPTTVTLPASITLTSDTFLNDPFTFLNGSKVVTKTDWACRQQEINLLFQRYELGTLPPAPSSLTSSLSGSNLTINASQGGKSISFVVTITYPAGNGPFPAIIGIGGISIPTPAGVAVINFNNDDMALQNDGTSRGVGKFYTLYGTNATAGAMTAWAWGVSRIIDALEMTAGNAKIDLTRLAVSGCSRNGKGALVAGAFEPRIWLTIPQESGSGGAGSWRISNAMLAAGQDTQTAPEIVQENVWFSPVFNQYVNQVNNLPFDHHMLSALVSPRPLFVIDNTDYVWLGPESVWGAQVTANKVWQALGIPDLMGVSQIGGHLHCSFPSSQQADLNAFVNRFLFGQAANTSILRTDGGNGASSFVSSSWVNWAVPTLT